MKDKNLYSKGRKGNEMKILLKAMMWTPMIGDEILKK